MNKLAEQASVRPGIPVPETITIFRMDGGSYVLLPEGMQGAAVVSESDAGPLRAVLRDAFGAPEET
jgi:hypothetical protein